MRLLYTILPFVFTWAFIFSAVYANIEIGFLVWLGGATLSVFHLLYHQYPPFGALIFGGLFSWSYFYYYYFD